MAKGNKGVAKKLTKENKLSKSGASSKAKGAVMKNSKAKKKAAPADGGVKRRFKPGTVALRQIKKYQKTIDHLIPRAPFQRFVRSICEGIDHQVRF